MKQPITHLGDLICETLTFCYEPGHKRSLGKSAKEMGATFEQFIAAALAQRISENFDVRHKVPPGTPSETRSVEE